MIIPKKLLPLQPFCIPVNGLKAGRSQYEWHADGEFFGTFENSEIKDADLDISVSVNNEDFSIEVSCRITGTVTVTCDRCLDDVTLSVGTEFEDDEFEGVDVIDLRQDIYDYVCISLPMVRTHPEGECNPETTKYLSK